ncbi:MAG TPA: acetolactate synthase small subunit [Bacillota bacterium]|jgi:acetolactate synthase-1/3 small subunit|nr:acetolactate synthase small subunit [Bacillota bacterium]HOL08678.1 acetolactate synthase small subunit [Bacillota bacterium]HPO96620.1 acetolactate synthase small subunit [Bacillota bacterium]
MRHVISALVVNQPGVMVRVAGLFSRRGYNIESIAVGRSEDPGLSRIVIVVDAEDDQIVEQIEKQLYKLIDVVKVNDLPAEDSVERELALIKVNASSQNRSEIMQIVDIFRAKIVDVSSRAVIIEITGGTAKVEALIALLKSYGIKEIVRTGQIAMLRTLKKGEK